jgi:uncharacterized membrane protein YbhN (UPF0104 family)
MSNLIRNLLESLKIYKDYKNIMALSVVLSFAFFMTNVIAMYCFVRTADQQVSLIALSFIVPTVFLVVMIPVSVNGIGLQEGSFFFYFSLLEMDSSAAMLIAFLPRIGMVVLSLIGALLFMTESLGGKKKSSPDREEEPMSAGKLKNRPTGGR